MSSDNNRDDVITRAAVLLVVQAFPGARLLPRLVTCPRGVATCTRCDRMTVTVRADDPSVGLHHRCAGYL